MSVKNESMNKLQQQDIFSEYLNFNNFNNDIMNESFPKQNNEFFDKYLFSDESSIRSLNSMNDYTKPNLLNRSLLYESQPQTENYHLHNINENNYENFKRMNINNLSRKKEIKFNLKKDINKENNQFILKKEQNKIIQNKENIGKELKQKKLLMNRESAKKSRLKKKAYIENLEKGYLELKTEYIKMIQNINPELKNNLTENENIIKDNKINKNLKIGKENVLYEFNQNEKEIISNNSDINKKKIILENLLINQIDIMTPINIKIMQNKFLKLNKLDKGDNFEVIKNKINSNLEIIKEIYDITDNDNNINKKLKSYQLYDFYKNILLLLDKYEIIIKYTSNITSV